MIEFTYNTVANLLCANVSLKALNVDDFHVSVGEWYASINLEAYFHIDFV